MLALFPNLLSLLRIVLTPLFMLGIYHGPATYVLAVGLFTVAAVTDYLDGLTARTFGVVSKVGSFLDPLADKVLMIGAFGLFYLINLVDGWVLFCMVLRDVIVTTLRILALSRGPVLTTSMLAKAKTVFQFATIYLIMGLLVYYGSLELLVASWWSMFVIRLSSYLVVGACLYSAADYLIRFFPTLIWYFGREQA